MSLFFPPLQCVIFPCFCHKTVLRPAWRVLTWIFCIQAFHIHVIYSLRIRSVKALIITIPFILWRCEISPSKIIWRLERLIENSTPGKAEFPHRGDESVQRLPPLCVLDSDWTQVVSEPDGRDDPACVAVSDVLLCGRQKRRACRKNYCGFRVFWAAWRQLIQLCLENPFRAFCNLIFIVSSGVYESVEHCLWIKSPQKS